jgi:predicted nucleotidyltransferase
MCILDKYTRAKHAILGGADCVIELPAPFAVAPAEIFAIGAIKILSAIPNVTSLAFGCENSKLNFIESADILLNESEEFKRELNKNLEMGESYIKSFSKAFELCGGKGEILDSSNNILGIEYTKAIKKLNADISILPIQRVGSGYNDENIAQNFSSATAIRKNLSDEKVKLNVPDFVYEDLKGSNCREENFNLLQRYALLTANSENMKRIFGCTEGLENRLKCLCDESIEEILKKSTSKRYSLSRIKRIILCNFLGLYSDDCKRFLDSQLYIKVLAIKKSVASTLISELEKSPYPLRGASEYTAPLSETAEECYEIDKKVYEKWRFINGFKCQGITFDRTLFL